MQDIPESIKELKRFKQVLQTLIKYELGFLLDSMHIRGKSSDKITEPATMRRVLEELGGSFVKLGQLLSLRPDLIPSKYCSELGLLQDSVKPFDYEFVRKTIEKQTGKKITSIFSKFSKKPLASASIGQVHEAWLKTGERVAVKIQRPGIVELMQTDIEIMTHIARQLKQHLSQGIVDPEEIVQEFKQYTTSELNYLNELQMINTFHESFKGTSIKIPKAYPEYSTERVLIMEYIDGTKLNEYIKSQASAENRKELANELVNSFFKQVFVDGTFHADPHPGNILVLSRELYPNHKLAFLDFGISGEIESETKKDLLSLFIAMIARDLDGITSAMLKLHLLNEDTPSFKRDLRDMLHPYYNVGLSKIDISKIFLQTLKVAKKYKVRVPRDYVLLGKAIITLESVCTLLYPEFNLIESAKPFLARIMVEKHRPRELIKQGISKMTNFERFVGEMPDMVKQYFQQNNYQTEYLRELAEHMYAAQKRTDLIMERFMLAVVGIIMLVTGFFLSVYAQNNDSFAIFSVFSFLLAFAIFFIFLKTFAHKRDA